MRVGDGILTDLVLLAGGLVCSQGCDDFGRLRCDEPICTGVVRTPVCSLSEYVAVRVRLTAEHSSTAADVYRLTGTRPRRRISSPHRIRLRAAPPTVTAAAG